MSNLKWNEDLWRERTHHSSGCNCVRWYSGRLIITRRNCDCGGFGMTIQKAITQTINELGEINAGNQQAIIARRNEIMKESK